MYTYILHISHSLYSYLVLKCTVAAYCLCTSRINTHKCYIQSTQYIYVLFKFTNKEQLVLH